MASDWIDTVVIIELKQVYADHCLPNNIDNSNDEIDLDWDFLASVATVLKYYMTDSEYNEWINEHASKN